MIEVPHYTPGVGLDRDAHERGVTRAVYYGSTGILDPRALFLEPVLFYFHYRRLRDPMMPGWRVTRRSAIKAGYRMSARLAAVTVMFGALGGYTGADPLNVTPGYGHTPVEGGMTVDGEYHSYAEYLARGLDTRQYYM